MENIDSPFQEDEVRHATFALGSDKAPGTDGFPLMFYTNFWDIIKSDLMRIFNDLYNHNIQLHRLNEALIVLIPKKDGAVNISDFRPISLLNGVYKIIAKILAIRLRKVIQALIDPAQAAFLPGKSTLHSVAAAQEIVMACKMHTWEGIFVKIDFRKAFDTLDWDFLLSILCHRGFPSSFVAWISSCLTLSTSRIQINNCKGNHIPCRRGLRQGDPYHRTYSF